METECVRLSPGVNSLHTLHRLAGAEASSQQSHPGLPGEWQWQGSELPDPSQNLQEAAGSIWWRRSDPGAAVWGTGNPTGPAPG